MALVKYLTYRFHVCVQLPPAASLIPAAGFLTYDDAHQFARSEHGNVPGREVRVYDVVTDEFVLTLEP